MESLDRLQELFVELFQLDMADLDFGLYRLLNLQRREVDAFIREQLPAEVDKAFAAVTADVKREIEDQVAQVAKEARLQLGDAAFDDRGEIVPAMRAQTMPVIQAMIANYDQARARLQTLRVSEGYKAEVFHHLVTFFSRYYDEGDFIPHRRYGAHEEYAVPYSGEEVFFYWANHDQHYVKDAERFRDYAFQVRDLTGEFLVRFVLVEASVPKDNLKGERRFFFPRADGVAFDAEGRTLTVPFEYRLPTEGEILAYRATEKGKTADQGVILERMAAAVLEAVPDGNLRALLAVDQRSEKAKEEEKPEMPLLLRRMRHFARRNTTDYFVHRNLREFLQRELEFYVKDQVLRLADLEGDFEAKRRVIRVFRRLAEQVIEFLAQVEDAEKLLFEKKKFVLETAYLVPIQDVPRDFWPEIVGNERQRAEWQAWLAVEPQRDLFNPDGEINEAFLEGHPTLPVHTAHFKGDFTRRLLEALPYVDLDEATDGLLVHGENYQALRLLTELYRGRIQCSYIDPPYNTGGDDFVYKDRYQHSTWLSMMAERLRLSRELLANIGATFVSIDENELFELTELMQAQMGRHNQVETIVWNKRVPKNDKGIGNIHEYVSVFAKDLRIRRKVGLRFDVYKAGIDKINDLVARAKSRGWSVAKSTAALRKLYAKEGFDRGITLYNEVSSDYRVWGKINLNWPSPRSEGPKYEIVHPVTGKAVRTPKRGWRWTEATFRSKLGEDVTVLEDGSVISGRIWFGPDEATQPSYIHYFEEVKERLLRSIISLKSSGSLELEQLGLVYGTVYPKPLALISELVFAGGAAGGFVIDYFAGSGTTAHAVIDLNRQDDGQRKFILVEVDSYFDAVLLPRIAKVMYAPEWREGKAARLPTAQEAERAPHLVKIVRLESFEDALHNIATKENLDRLAARRAAYRQSVGAEVYRMRYLVDLPARAAETMLDTLKLEHPFDYTLEVLGDEGTQNRPVDLMETFNYLYGLRVGCLLTWENEQDVTARDPKGRVYRVNQAVDREKRRRVMVVWRDMTEYRPEEERRFLEEKLREMAENEDVWDEMLINGDCATPGFESVNGKFKQLMMAGEDR